MAISSEQYKTALFEQARRALRVEDESRRVAYYDMVYRVLEHDGVVVDYDGYDGFRVAMEGYLNYLSDSNLLIGDDIFNDDNFVVKYDEFWGKAFAGIGITSTVSKADSWASTATFTFVYQDNETETYVIDSYNDGSPVQMNVRFNSTLDYAQKVMPYWNIQPDENTIPLNEISGNRGSFVTNWGDGGVYWHYDKESQTIEFTGEGALVMKPTQFLKSTNGLSIGTVMTAIFGAGIKKFPYCAFDWGSGGEERTVVCMHGATDVLDEFPSLLSGAGSQNYPYVLHLYCDNESIRTYAFPKNTVVDLHYLSEWTG